MTEAGKKKILNWMNNQIKAVEMMRKEVIVGDIEFQNIAHSVDFLTDRPSIHCNNVKPVAEALGFELNVSDVKKYDENAYYIESSFEYNGAKFFSLDRVNYGGQS